jgi:hypothetical protein
MMAFFESLVQREIEGWSSEESVSSEVSATGYAETVQDALNSPSSDSESVHSGKRVKTLCIYNFQFLAYFSDFENMNYAYEITLSVSVSVCACVSMSAS